MELVPTEMSTEISRRPLTSPRTREGGSSPLPRCREGGSSALSTCGRPSARRPCGAAPRCRPASPPVAHPAPRARGLARHLRTLARQAAGPLLSGQGQRRSSWPEGLRRLRRVAVVGPPARRKAARCQGRQRARACRAIRAIGGAAGGPAAKRQQTRAGGRRLPGTAEGTPGRRTISVATSSCRLSRRRHAWRRALAEGPRGNHGNSQSRCCTGPAEGGREFARGRRAGGRQADERCRNGERAEQDGIPGRLLAQVARLAGRDIFSKRR